MAFMQSQKLSSGMSGKFAMASLICSFLVVLLHSGDSETLPQSVSWYYQMLVPYGLCAVAIPFFFFQSGFFLAGRFYEKEWYSVSLRKRMRTLLLPYMVLPVLFVLFRFAVVAMANIAAGRSIAENFRYDLLSMWGLDPCRGMDLYVLWYIRALMILVLLSPAIKWAIEHISLKLLLPGLWLLYAIVVPGSEIHETLMQAFFKWTFSLLGLFYFSLGMAARKGQVLSGRFWSFVGIVGCGTLIVHVLLDGRIGCLRPIYCIGLFVTLWRMVPNIPVSRSSSYFSFSVYVLHPFFLILVGIVTGHKPLSGLSMFVAGVVTLFSCLLLAALLKKVFPKTTSFLFGGR